MKNNRVENAYEKPSMGLRMALWKVVATFIGIAGLFVGQLFFLIQDAHLIQDPRDNFNICFALFLVSLPMLLAGFEYLGKFYLPFWRKLAFRFGFDPGEKDTSGENRRNFVRLVLLVYCLVLWITMWVVGDILLNESGKKTMGFIGECHSGRWPQCDCRYEAEGNTYVCRLNRDDLYLHNGDTVFLEYYPPLPTICRFLESK